MSDISDLEVDHFLLIMVYSLFFSFWRILKKNFWEAFLQEPVKLNCFALKQSLGCRILVLFAVAVFFLLLLFSFFWQCSAPDDLKTRIEPDEFSSPCSELLCWNNSLYFSQFILVYPFTFSIQLAVDVQIPDEFGGLNGEAIYIGKKTSLIRDAKKCYGKAVIL